MIKIKVNGRTRAVEADPDTPLLWALREQLDLTGVKYGCGVGECGACTVHLDGEPTPSCGLTLEEVGDREVTTIEGLSGRVADALFRAWTAGGVPQCGYCQPGQLMQASALLAGASRPGEQEIEQAMSKVLCRCGTYQDIREAILTAIEELNP
ncbi:MAG: (2Fe-2S)-binding protein [Pseudomonadota bacterium]